MRITRVLVLAFVVSGLSVANAPAQGLTGKIGLSPSIGVNIPIQYLGSTEGGGRATTGFSFGTSGEYFVNDDISVGARFRYDRFGADLPNDNLSGYWTMIEFGAFGRCQFMPGKPTRPYARVGLLLGTAKATVKNGSEVETSVGMSPGAELAGGVSHQVKDNLAVFGELGWTALATDGKDADVSVDGTDTGSFEVQKHLQWIGVRVGVTFLLGGKTQ